MRLGLLASGRGSNVEAILRAIAEGRLEAQAVLLVCDRPGAPVIAVAERFGVPLELVSREAYPARAARQAAIADALRGYQVDLVALAGFGSILDRVVTGPFRDRILNIHPSLLPAFAGTMAPGPQAAALEAGVKVSGCTVHLVTDAVDAGPIVAQAAVPVLDDDTLESLSARILAAEHRLYPEVLRWFVEGRVSVTPGGTTVIRGGTRVAGQGTAVIGGGTTPRRVVRARPGADAP